MQRFIKLRSLATVTSAPRLTLIEKIASRHAVDGAPAAWARQGDYIALRPRHILTHDNSAAVMAKFARVGATRIFDRTQPVLAIDHDVQSTTAAHLAKVAAIAEFAATHSLPFHKPGRGIGHQIMIEEGYVAPGALVVASDSHANMYGALGALGTPLVRTDAAAVWATGRTWWQVPPVVRVELTGRPRPGIVGKDVIVALCATYSRGEVLNTAIEFVGDGIAALVITDRLTIANMTTEWGALAGVFPADARTAAWLQRAASHSPSNPRLAAAARDAERAVADRAADKCGDYAPDAGAHYTRTLSLDLSTVEPSVAGPNSVTRASPASALSSVRIDKAYLVSCTNSRAEDLAAAARVIRAAGQGARVADGVQWYVAPASSRVLEDAKRAGDWETILGAGAIELPSGCGPCVGLGAGLLRDGEVGISASNRNFKGRMGSPNAQAYLASPAIVAASALAGHIALPTNLPEFELYTTAGPAPVAVCHQADARIDATTAEETLSTAVDGFPAQMEGGVICCLANNLSTDGMYPGKYTYQDSMSPAAMARVVMENYDPRFASQVAALSTPTPFLMAGANFGCGSSREQAATALLAAGIRIVLCVSASETFKRNALNNGLIVIECPELVAAARHRLGPGNGLTALPSWQLSAQLVSGTIAVRFGSEVQSFAVPRVGAAAQELVRDGGLEAWIRRQLQNKQI
ncbi:homoaconitase [Blastocladiella britannica]|nr:homoaconitase [Blastocladiella britannica]